jgi:thymidylate kinase
MKKITSIILFIIINLSLSACDEMVSQEDYQLLIAENKALHNEIAELVGEIAELAYIDIDPQEAMKRITARSGSMKTELFEKKTFLEGVRKNFLSIINKNFLIVDGNLPVDEIFNIIKDDYLNEN